MSLLSTAVPSGTIEEWCIKSLYYDFDGEEFNTCGNSTRGTTESDFQTICCDGGIINARFDLWSYNPNRTEPTYVDLADLVCCGVHGPQQGGFQPIQYNGLTCTAGSPTPLASLAATNIKNAQNYLVTYTSASFGAGTEVGDFIPTQTPYCLWASTGSEVEMSSITVSAASIETLPPASTDMWGLPISSSGLMCDPSICMPTATASKSSTTSSTTSSAAGTFDRPTLRLWASIGVLLLPLVGLFN